MESFPAENLMTVKALLQSLSTQLNESNAHIAALEKLSTTMVPAHQHQDTHTTKKPAHALALTLSELSSINESKEDANSDEDVDVDDHGLIAELEHQRLVLVSDIQKQEYVTKKLTTLVDQHADMIQTIKDYLLSSQHNHVTDTEISHIILNRYTDVVAKLVEDKLKINIYDIQQGTQIIQTILKGLIEGLQENTLFDYSLTLSALIKDMNALFDREYQ